MKRHIQELVRELIREEVHKVREEVDGVREEVDGAKRYLLKLLGDVVFYEKPRLEDWVQGLIREEIAARRHLPHVDVSDNHELPPGVNGDARVGETAGRGRGDYPRPAHRAMPVNDDGIARARKGMRS